MPELPEVETVARQLHAVLSGRRLLELEVRDPKLKVGLNGYTSIRGTVKEVVRRGKQVIVVMRATGRSGKGRSGNCFAIHLRMTGRLLWEKNNHRNTEAQKGERVESRKFRARFKLSGGEVLFVDTRRFGTLSIYPSLAALPAVGVEPLGLDFTEELLVQLLRKNRQPIKPWLLRQDRIVGIGNIYASEILFHAGISPKRLASRITSKEAQKLYRAVRHVLARAIKFCGTTFSDFQDTSGETGSFQRFLKVYERESLPCRRCKSPIRRIVQQQRSTYYCPFCQH